MKKMNEEKIKKTSEFLKNKNYIGKLGNIDALNKQLSLYNDPENKEDTSKYDK